MKTHTMNFIRTCLVHLSHFKLLMMAWQGDITDEARFTQVIVRATVTLVTLPPDGMCRAVATCDVHMMRGLL